MSRIRSIALPVRALLPVLALTLLWPTASALAQGAADHLLLGEVVVMTRADRIEMFGSPFIEVVNPTDAIVDLSDVYLCTGHDASLGQLYWNMVTGENLGGGTSGNVHCKFPAGATLADGQALVISINGSAEFQVAYGFLPDFELYEDGSDPDAVAEMVEVVPGTIRAGLGSADTNVPALSSISDSIVLYRWDGESDLVEDLDYLVWGSDTRYRVDKTGVAMDGPDDGDVASSYLADTAVASQISAGAAHTFGQAFKRVDTTESGEAQSGGNGATGHDETSEALATSWANDAAQDPPGPPATWFPAAPIVTDGTVGDFYADMPTSIELTAVAVDIVDGMSVWYTVDGGALAFVDGSDQGDGNWQAEIPAQSAGAVVTWYAMVSGSDGGQAIWPAGGDKLPATVTVAGVPAPEITSAVAGAAVADYPCTVTVQVTAVNQELGGTLYYAVDGGAFEDTPLTADGTTLIGEIPGQDEGTVVAWYVVVEDSDLQTDTHPEGAPTTVEEVTFSLASMGPAKLLITEVNTGPNIFPSFTGMLQIAPEFIEIHNPNGFAVNMSDFYITDAINYNFSTQVYWAITDGSPSQSTVGGGNYNDFTARFPADFIIAAEQTIVVSTASSGWFEQVYNKLPDIELYEDEMSVEGVPEMRPVFDLSTEDRREDSIFTPDRDPGSDEMPRGIPEVEEHYGEPVILYHWAPGAPTVTDIDVFMLGEEKTGAYGIGFDKSEVPGYQPDTPILDQDWITDMDETGSVSYTRTDADEGTQTTTGGNGVDGRDETSENLTETFALVYPTPGVFFAGLEATNDVSLTVEPKTFLLMGETFPISMVSLENSETKLRILDLEGRLVITLWDSRFDGSVSGIPDFPTVVRWDGRDDTFRQVRAGMYIVHLQAVNRLTGDKIVKTAPVVVATRLK